jgi:hypothetical protein
MLLSGLNLQLGTSLAKPQQEASQSIFVLFLRQICSELHQVFQAKYLYKIKEKESSIYGKGETKCLNCYGPIDFNESPTQLGHLFPIIKITRYFYCPITSMCLAAPSRPHSPTAQTMSSNGYMPTRSSHSFCVLLIISLPRVTIFFLQT